MTRSAAKQKTRVFYATVQVTRIEEWFVEAETSEQARSLLQSGAARRSHVGECVHFEIERIEE